MGFPLIFITLRYMSCVTLMHFTNTNYRKILKKFTLRLKYDISQQVANCVKKSCD